MTRSFCAHHSGAGRCDWSSLEGQSRVTWIGDGIRKQDTGLEPQLPIARRELGLLPAPASGGWRSGQLSSSEADRLPLLCSLSKREGKGSVPPSEDANPPRGHAPDLITSQKPRLLRHHLVPQVFSLEILRGCQSLRLDSVT